MIATVLAIAGSAKLRDPVPARRLLYRLGLRVPARAIRVVGVGELGLGAAVLTAGGRIPAALLAAAHLGFSGVAVAGIREGAAEGCGCFGARSDAPLGPQHLVTTAASTAVAVAATFVPVRGVGEPLDEGWLHLVAHLGLVAVGAALLIAVYTDAAATGAAVRQARPQPDQPAQPARRARRVEAAS